MNLNRAFAAFACLCFSLFSFAQKDSLIVLRTGALLPKHPLSPAGIDSFNLHTSRFSGKSIVWLRFASAPAEPQKQQLAAGGVELNNYIVPGLYSATITGNISYALLRQSGVTAMITPSPTEKIDPWLAGGRIPSWCVKVPGTMDVIASFPPSFSYNQLSQFLRERNIDIVSAKWASYGRISLRLRPGRLTELASLPFIEYVQAAEPELVLFNHKSRQGARANVLNATASNGGLGLNGEGVAIGIGDNTSIFTHMDFAGRHIERNTFSASHGIHVAGTAAGAGIINELYRGYAPRAQIINALQDDIVSETYIRDYNMVLTNNSYGAAFQCDVNGLYDPAAWIIDQVAIRHPFLLNVYAGGNYAGATCAPFPPGFNTISSLWQTGKNTLTVGGTTDSGNIGTFSSRGPLKDGRLKPEIVAMGLQVTSAWPTNIYSFNTGTSMSAPAVVGGAALLYQRYRQLNAGADPRNGLIKAILCNGATDKGNPGPDFTYGFGGMNLLRSVDMLEKRHYVMASATPNSLNTHTISIPAGTAQLKVMLYWNDPAAAPMAVKALVNDLDLEVGTPSSGTVLPLVLDPTPARVNTPAVQGIDRLNNIEQVVIDHPAAGNYTARIKGTSVGQNPQQEYFLVYDIVPVSLVLTNPVGGEGLVPGEPVKIAWDAYGNTDRSFSLQFSADQGASWTDIATGLDPARRIYTWQVPAVVSSTALIRIVQQGSGLTAVSRPFTIIGLPVVSLSPVQCETYININWNAVAGADQYEVMMLQGDDMKLADVTTATQYKFTNLSKQQTYWVGVRAVVNGKAGRRSVAVSRKPDHGSCSGSISDNDLLAEALISPATGRKFSSSSLLPAHAVTFRIKNLDDAPVNGFTVSYAVNNGNWKSEHVAVTIAAGSSYDHTFSTTEDLSAVGSYRIAAVVKNDQPDASVFNDTLVSVVRHLDNQPINLSATFLDNLESALPFTYINDTMGLSGIDRYDFQSTTRSGQVNTFFNSGFASSGSRAFMLGETWQHNFLGMSYVMGTFNLSNYTVASNNLRADFRYVNTHFSGPNTSLWARGADNLPWIKIFDIPRSDTLYRTSPSLPIADSLAAHGQNFTGSFQLRWGLSSLFQSLSKRRMFTVDDVRLYEAVNDVQALRIDTPNVMSCDVTGNVPVTLRVHNSHFSALANVPVKYSVNGGPWVEEVIPSIPGKSNLQYTFVRPLNMSAHGTYLIKAVVAYPSDNIRSNDTATAEVQNSTLVTSFPYLQNFESGKEGWYTSGQMSSWEYGTPASAKIRGAASGARAWKTNLSGNHNNNERSYLYSPCFTLAGLTRPALSFSLALELEDCFGLCDGAWVEYTVNGTTWSKLGSAFINTNWYNNGTVQQWTNLDYTRWHVATWDLPLNVNSIRFRFAFSSNDVISKEGIAIDDFHIYENARAIYDSATMTSPVTETVSGNGWTNFTLSGKLLASVKPNNPAANISMDAQVYIDSPGVRSTSTQYYHNRSLTLKSATPLTDSLTVRFYFLDSETERLIFASGCTACAKPSSAYQLGVSTYNDANDDLENGTIHDNRSGKWSFINALNVAKVPFNRGYYAEFKVKELSEFWLNNGGHDLDAHLAIQLIDFTAQRAGSRNVVLSWRMGNEDGITKYDIEMARDHAAVQGGQFIRITQQQAQGSTSSVAYHFTDTDPDKFDTVYYRLKIVYQDGRTHYSAVRAVVFEEAVTWKLYPNPSPGRFYLDYPGSATEWMFVSLFDAKGSLVQSFYKQGGGFMQKLVIDISNTSYPDGVYLLRINQGNTVKTFKLHKQ